MEFSVSQILKLRRFKNFIIVKFITFQNSEIADIGGSAGLILGMSAFTIFLQIEGNFIKMAYMIILTVDKVSLVLEIFEDFLTKCCRLCRRKYNRRKSRRQSRKFQPLSSSATGIGIGRYFQSQAFLSQGLTRICVPSGPGICV